MAIVLAHLGLYFFLSTFKGNINFRTKHVGTPSMWPVDAPQTPLRRPPRLWKLIEFRFCFGAHETGSSRSGSGSATASQGGRASATVGCRQVWGRRLETGVMIAIKADLPLRPVWALSVLSSWIEIRKARQTELCLLFASKQPKCITTSVR